MKKKILTFALGTMIFVTASLSASAETVTTKFTTTAGGSATGIASCNTYTGEAITSASNSMSEAQIAVTMIRDAIYTETKPTLGNSNMNYTSVSDSVVKSYRMAYVRTYHRAGGSGSWVGQLAYVN